MADKPVQFEQSDIVGSTDVFDGTVGTSWEAVPAVAGSEIQSFTVINDQDNPISKTLFVSLDGGSTYLDEIYPSGDMTRVVKGGLTQIWIKGATASVQYRVILDREE